MLMMRRLNSHQTRRLIRRIRMNLFYHPKQTLMIIIITVCLLYVFYQVFSTPPINHDNYDSQFELLTNINKCQPMNPMTYMVFETFVRRIINTFDMLEVTYFLCYETLWTALKRANNQEQQSDIKKNFVLKITDSCFNLCVLNEDIVKHDESIIVRRFNSNGISIQYTHSDGIYILKPTTRLIEMGQTINGKDKIDESLHPILFSIHARVHVFEKDSQQDMFRRVGWRSRLLPSTMCKQLHCFPTNLVQGKFSLPKLEFLPTLQINVPREGLEIQKYHYPDSWWTMTDSIADECA